MTIKNFLGSNGYWNRPADQADREPGAGSREPGAGSQHVRVPVEVLTNDKLSNTAKLLYCVLESYAGSRRKCWPALTTLGDRLKVGPAWVSKCIKELEAAGLIKVTEQPGRSNLYCLTGPNPHTTHGGFSSNPHTTHDPTPHVKNQNPPCTHDMNHVLNQTKESKPHIPSFNSSDFQDQNPTEPGYIALPSAKDFMPGGSRHASVCRGPACECKRFAGR